MWKDQNRPNDNWNNAIVVPKLEKFRQISTSTSETSVQKSALVGKAKVEDNSFRKSSTERVLQLIITQYIWLGSVHWRYKKARESFRVQKYMARTPSGLIMVL